MANGKHIDPFWEKVPYFHHLYIKQAKFQDAVEGMSPHDNPEKFQYHITALQEEIGEVLKADKRWKTHRNVNYDKDEKLDELSDAFITLMNLAMWSGFSSGELLNGVESKIKRNTERLQKERG